jgi:hypothetical protein
MFTLDQNITGPELRKKDLLKFFFSMNTHQVATPEMMLEDARSYVLFFRENGGKCSSYVGLHLLLTDRRLFYAHASNPFSADEMDSVEEEALCFVEGLGALTDTADLAKLTSEEKRRWMEDQAVFSVSPPPAAQQETPEAGAAMKVDTISATATEAVQQNPPEAGAAQESPAPARPRARPGGRTVRSKAARAAASTGARPDPTQKAIKDGVKQSKPSIKEEVRAAAGVVSRDREALARLLASF